MALIRRNKPAAQVASPADDDFTRSVDAQIKAKSVERSLALEEVSRLDSEAELGDLPGEAEYSKLKYQARVERKRADEAANFIEVIEHIRSSPFVSETRERIEHHARKIASAVRANSAALWDAASKNTDVIAAVQAAREELTDEVALTLTSPSDVVYNGLVREDLALTYSRHADRIVAGFDRAVPRMVQKAVDKRIRSLTQRPSTAPPTRQSAPPAARMAPISPITTASRSPVQEVPFHNDAPALADETGPLAEGFVWVKVARAGHPDREGRQSQRGRVIQKPHDEAQAAVRNGAVEYFSPPGSMLDPKGEVDHVR